MEALKCLVSVILLWGTPLFISDSIKGGEFLGNNLLLCILFSIVGSFVFAGFSGGFENYTKKVAKGKEYNPTKIYFFIMVVISLGETIWLSLSYS